VQVRCPHCLSTRYEQSDSAIEPPLPPVFGELGERLTMFLGAHENKKHPWGVDGVEDSTRIIAELSAVDDEPDFYRHILMGAMFARSLIMGKNYSTEIDYNMMLTALGNLERQYFDATGELAVGLDAVGVFEDAARVAPDAANLASSEHNVAMAINSLLIKYPDDGLAQATGRAHLRNDALEAASRALAGYGAIPAGTMFPVAGAALTATQQAGRIHHLMGDLLAHAQMDDDRLRVAIAHYDAALDAGLPDAILRGVRESRAGALSNLSAPTQEELEAAAAELQYLTS
jgi:hypothetical protein